MPNTMLDIIKKSIFDGKGLDKTVKQLARIRKFADQSEQKHFKAWQKAVELENDYDFYRKHGDQGVEELRELADVQNTLDDKRTKMKSVISPNIAELMGSNERIQWIDNCSKKKKRDRCIDDFFNGKFLNLVPTEKEIKADPILYSDSESPIIREYARRLLLDGGNW